MAKLLWVNNSWTIEGDLPNGLQFAQGVFLTSSGDRAPECFGELWDGISAEDCRLKCDFSPCCLELTAKRALPAAQRELGSEHSLGRLSDLLGISEASLLAMEQYKQGGANPLAKTRKKAPPLSVIGDAGEQPREAATVAPAESEPLVTASASSIDDVEEPEDEPVSETIEDRRSMVPSGPSRAPSAPRAKGGAMHRRKKRVRPAALAKVQVAYIHSERKGWGEHTYENRWRRERARSPLIAQLQPGTVLQTLYRGKLCETTVLETGYLVQGMQVPTLYMATLCFTGTKARRKTKGEGTRQVGNYSAVKFWRLAELLGTTSKLAPGVDPKRVRVHRQRKSLTVSPIS